MKIMANAFTQLELGASDIFYDQMLFANIVLWHSIFSIVCHSFHTQ
jgi:hypothetical protein